ncbi:MAG: pilus assembly protein [Candidatus Dactylopiibacterium sp.]|nr:pilus assembly protein [Candidatus Dactylopiibacterium sp.]
MMRIRMQGAVAPLMLFLLGGVLATAVFVLDGTRLKNDAAQLKRATDAAAMATATAYARDRGADLQALALAYVQANLGTDAVQTGNRLEVSAVPFESDGEPAVRVTATFRATALLEGAGPAQVSVASAAAARSKSLEVALALPNTLGESAANLAVLRRLGKRFASRLVADRDNAWLALVPYSQSVNVYDAADSGRLRRWAMNGALNPVELTSLFRSGYASLADRRIPDRRANLLCLYRGLNQRENYFWDEAPAGQFRIHYRHDLPVNGSPGATPISWVGPNPDFGQANGVNDTRWMVADRGCPSAALLPLSHDLDAIGARLDAMSTRFNVNYAIAMGWSAMALAPAFRGVAGWGLPDDLPRDFSDDSRGAAGDTVKAIVFLVNSTDQRWFDTDAYNAWVGQKIDGDADTGGGEDSVVTRRFAHLCDSLRARKLRFFLIVTGSDEATDENGQVTSASDFRRIAGPGLDRCAEKDSDQTYLGGFDFTVSEGRIQDRLDAIVEELRQQANAVRLIE